MATKTKTRTDSALWWKFPKNEVHEAVFAAVRTMEAAQSDMFDRFVRLEVLYDPNTPITHEHDDAVANVSENMIASNVDTIAAAIATTDVLARVETDGADWVTWNRARRLEWYAEEQQIKLGVTQTCRKAFRESAKKGMGLTKCTAKLGRPVVEHVLIDNIIVDPNECRDGKTPWQMHEWVTCDADELAARFPKFEEDIERERLNNRRQTWRSVLRMPLAVASNDITYLESFRRPIGEPGFEGYKPGRHTICIQGATMLDEPWEDDLFPYGLGSWTERTTSFYPIGGAERIAGIQRAMNKTNWQTDRAAEQIAMPTTYVRPVDANLTTKSSRVGGVTVIHGEMPQTHYPTAIPAELWTRHDRLKSTGSEEFGQSQMATHAAKPAGLDSGVALREYRDQSSTRYSLQETMFEQLVIDTIWLVLFVCKKLGAKAPKMMRHTRFDSRTITWADVDMGDLKVQLRAAANLNRTPAGRAQMVLEWAQAGVISQDSAQRLLQHPDLEEEISLYTAAQESVEHAIDAIAGGKTVMPEPMMNLEMVVWRGQREYLKWQTIPKVPEERMEALRTFIVTAAWMSSQKNAPANQNIGAGAGAGAAPGQMPAQPPGPDLSGAGVPAMGMGPAQAGPVNAALSPQAMQLVAGSR